MGRKSEKLETNCRTEVNRKKLCHLEWTDGWMEKWSKGREVEETLVSGGWHNESWYSKQMLQRQQFADPVNWVTNLLRWSVDGLNKRSIGRWRGRDLSTVWLVGWLVGWSDWFVRWLIVYFLGWLNWLVRKAIDWRLAHDLWHLYRIYVST